MLHSLNALSPLDGRYQQEVTEIAACFSEFSLIKHRVIVEIEWFIALFSQANLFDLSKNEVEDLRDLGQNFSLHHANQVKETEKITKHDIKAVEYFLREFMQEHSTLKHKHSFIHFGLTSEDVNNVAYALMLKQCKEKNLLTIITKIIEKLENLSPAYPMISLTHGQPATPTTLKKEMLVFASRLDRQKKILTQMQISAKCNGAVGNFNAHIAAYPNIAWQNIAKKFIESFDLEYNPLTTQIEPHDTIAEHADSLCRINTILLDLAQDMWGYISRGYFFQKISKGQVGSSTMPHKINPINFENAEGNLGLANAILSHLARKLPNSRFQRDLSDSTVMRNLGTSIGYAYLSYLSLIKGMDSIEPNQEKMQIDLNNNWQLLAEPVQTIMRKYGIDNAYEALKEFTQTKSIHKDQYILFVKNLPIPDIEKEYLLNLTPSKYLGLYQ